MKRTPDMEPGLLTSRYEVLASVSKTRNSEVFKARDREHDTIVAIKVVAVDDHAPRRDVLAETATLLRLPPHPGLPTVRFDFAVPGGYAIVMDWVDGADLGHLLRVHGSPGLPASSVVNYISQAAQALDHLAMSVPSVIHGDVNPANLMLTPGGRIVLVDFGLAGVGPRVGTRGYVAPEVAAGRPATPAADVYALAATAVALLTGRPPDGSPPSFDEVAPDQIAPFTRALRRGLMTDPTRRPRSAGELADALRAAGQTLWSGVLTFSVIGVADAPRLWDDRSELMPEICGRMDEIVTDAVEASGGRVLKAVSGGDLTWAVFRQASEAAGAARFVHARVAEERWPGSVAVSVRVGLHSGEPDVRDGEYRGPLLNLAARLIALAPGGCTVMSAAAAGLLRDRLPAATVLVEVGGRPLGGEGRTEPVFGLIEEGAAPFRLEADAADRSDVANHNLPVQLTKFIGRRVELDEVRKRVLANRLCTVVGPGGIGKTRLALQAASEVVTSFPDGAWAVDLFEIDGPDLVVTAVAAAVGAREGGSGTYTRSARPGGRTALDRLVDYLRSKTLLLVLDNCEHIRAYCLELARELLRKCTGLTILATSREPLGLSGEATYRLTPLEVPGKSAPAALALQSEAAQLFLDRAALRSPTLRIDDTTIESISSICRNVEGVPLAIELAAGQLGVFALREIDQKLGEAGLPEDSGPTTSRQGSLRATTEWSYRALSIAEQELLERLSVFAGGFTLDAVTAVCTGPGCSGLDVVNLLSGLVDKSLVEATSGVDVNRFRFAEWTRRYAAERLERARNADEIRAAHLRWCLTLSDVAEDELTGSSQPRWLDTLESELDNLRVAFDFAHREGRGDDLRLAARLAQFFLVRGRLTEGRTWLDTAIGSAGARADSALGRAFCASAMLSCFAGDGTRAEITTRLALEIARTLGDRRLEARALSVLALTAGAHGRQAVAEQCNLKAIAAAQDCSDSWLASVALTNLGNDLALRGSLGEARSRYEDALMIRRSRNDLFGLCWTLFRLGMLTTWEGDFSHAVALLEESLECARQIRYEQGTLLALIGLGETYHANAHQKRARRCLEQALELAQELEEKDLECVVLSRLTCAAAVGGHLREADRWAALRDSADRGESAVAGTTVLRSRAFLARAQGQAPQAEAFDRGALLLCAEMGDLRGVIEQLEFVAIDADMHGDLRRSSRCLAAAAALRLQRGWPTMPLISASLEDVRARAAAEGIVDAVVSSTDGLANSAVAMALAMDRM